MSDLQIIISTLENKVKALEGALSDRGDAGMMSGWIPGWGSVAGGSGINLSVFSFGCAFSGTQVTVLGGYVRRGFRTPIYISSDSFYLGSGLKWSYVTYSLSAGTATLTTNASSVPDDTADAIYIALHQYQLIAGVASVTSGGVHHIGDIFLPGETA